MYDKAEKNEIISSRFDLIPSLGVFSVACLTMGGHISLLVSRPVWYAASSAAAAGSPVPSLDSDSKPWDSLLHLSVHLVVCCKAGVESILHNMQAANGISPYKKISCCGKLHNLMAAISGVKLAHWFYGLRKNQECCPSPCFYWSSVERTLLAFFWYPHLLPPVYLCCDMLVLVWT